MSSPGAKPDKVARCQRPLHAHERRKLFSGPKSTARVDLGLEVDHVDHDSIYLEVTFPASLSIDLSVPKVLLYLLVFS